MAALCAPSSHFFAGTGLTAAETRGPKDLLKTNYAVSATLLKHRTPLVRALFARLQEFSAIGGLPGGGGSENRETGIWEPKMMPSPSRSAASMGLFSENACQN